jgi:anti-sigma factor RsiW
VSFDRPVSEEDLHSYVDDRLDPGRRAAVQAYLVAHPDVAARVAQYREQREALRAAFAPAAEAPLPPELNLERMVAAREHEARRSFAGWRIAASLVLTLTLGAAGGWLGRGMSFPPQTGVAALSREAADSYRVYAADQARPVEIPGAQQAALTEWISSRLKRPVAVPDLTIAGYSLLGGRLVATRHGPAGLFLYQNAQGVRLAVLVRQMEEKDRNAPMVDSHVGGLDGVAWADDGLGYDLSGPVPAHDLRPIANALRRQTLSLLTGDEFRG